MPDAYDPISSLPADTRARLEAFSAALERVGVGEFALFAVPPAEPSHGQARDAAAQMARERGLEQAVDAARQRIVGYAARSYQDAMLRFAYMGPNPTAGMGDVDERVIVMQGLADAATALVLGDALDEDTQAELLGPWDSLLEEE